MSKIPDQKQFNTDHSYPRPYGEDGDIAVGSNFTEDEALELFKQYWIDTDGEVPDYVNKDNVGLMSFGWSEHPDYKYDDDNMGYCLLYNSSIKPRYTGWVLQS